MARLFLLVLVFSMVTVIEGAPAPKNKKAKCKENRLYPQCAEREDLFCPNECPQDCAVECRRCEPVCLPPAPPPPPRPSNSMCRTGPRRCRNLFCPASCPDTCVANCDMCQAVCPPSPPPPPPVATPSPPPPVLVTPSPPPPVATPSPPPPPVLVTPSPPPPVATPSPPPPPPVATPSPPPPVTTPSPPPPPPVATPSPPPPITTPSPPPPVIPTPSWPPTPYIPPPPDSSEAAGEKRVRCKNKLFPECKEEHRCPPECPDRCVINCETCSPMCECNMPGAVCQDPRFIGADGLTFYFHGKKDKDFCIVSDTNLHINAHFIGRRNINIGRDFTWVQSLGILFESHRIYVGAKKTATWDNTKDRLDLSFDGQPVYITEGEGEKYSAPGVEFTRTRITNAVEIKVEGNFRIKATVVPITKQESQIHKYNITDDDCFVHLDLRFKFYSLSGDVTGVLGQTYASNYVSRVKMGIDMPVLGGDREFSSSSLFSTDCAAARFNGTQKGPWKDYQYAK